MHGASVPPAGSSVAAQPWVVQNGKSQGHWKLFTPPTKSTIYRGITAGPDGNVWVTDWQHGGLVRVTTGGVATEFPIPIPNARPSGITVGPDGDIWYTQIQAQTDLASIGSLKP